MKRVPLKNSIYYYENYMHNTLLMKQNKHKIMSTGFSHDTNRQQIWNKINYTLYNIQYHVYMYCKVYCIVYYTVY